MFGLKNNIFLLKINKKNNTSNCNFASYSKYYYFPTKKKQKIINKFRQNQNNSNNFKINNKLGNLYFNNKKRNLSKLNSFSSNLIFFLSLISVSTLIFVFLQSTILNIEATSNKTFLVQIYTNFKRDFSTNSNNSVSTLEEIR